MEFTNKAGIAMIHKMIKTIQENRDYLSEIDGAAGDGDHGINMSKGFTLAQEELKDQDPDLSQGLLHLSQVLMTKIGGSMGPLYGSLFRGMAAASKGHEIIDGQVFLLMLQKAYDRITDISPAKPGDKTLIDVLHPALEAYAGIWEEKQDMKAALTAMKEAALAGLLSTKDMVAKLGRASRLGERSRGHQDAGATSCCLILEAMAESVIEMEA